MDNNFQYESLGKPREAVGLFDDMEHLQEAVRELEGTAFPRDAISVLGAPEDVKETFGRTVVPPYLAEDDPNTPRQAPVRPEEKTIGASVLVGCSAYVGVIAGLLLTGTFTAPATLLAAGLSGGVVGAIIGAVLVKLLARKFHRQIAKQVSQGGLLLWVRTPDKERESLACEILQHHGARHIHVHDITH